MYSLFSKLKLFCPPALPTSLLHIGAVNPTMLAIIHVFKPSCCSEDNLATVMAFVQYFMLGSTENLCEHDFPKKIFVNLSCKYCCVLGEYCSKDNVLIPLTNNCTQLRLWYQPINQAFMMFLLTEIISTQPKYFTRNLKNPMRKHASE